MFDDPNANKKYTNDSNKNLYSHDVYLNDMTTCANNYNITGKCCDISGSNFMGICKSTPF